VEVVIADRVLARCLQLKNGRQPVSTMAIYQDRRHAGKVLANALKRYAGCEDVVVLGLPRGGVPVAFEVATALGAPLDAFVVRKLGVPGYRELAMGAIATGGAIVLNREVVDGLQIPKEVIDAVVQAERRELERRERAYRGDRPPIDVSGRTVILIDDGLATGASMRAAIAALRQRRPKRIVVGVPIAAPSTCEEVGREADDIVCAATPEPFQAVGLWYRDFSQTSDEEVRKLLEQAPQRHSSAEGTLEHK
jgi:predicted phosphoribosyltransferase